MHDDSDTPAIDILKEGCMGEEVEKYVYKSHRPILVRMPGSNQYRGLIWIDSKSWPRRMSSMLTDELGSDQKQAASAFREYLRSDPDQMISMARKMNRALG